MRCLIDADVLRYEIGFQAEASWRYKHADKEEQFFIENAPPWTMVEECLTQKLLYIETVCQATEPSTFFFTGKGNFRNDIATVKPYKTRPSNKPFHFKNVEHFIKSEYDWREQDGLEADDLLAIEQSSQDDRSSTIICSRDKDLRAVDGWVYSWELGDIPSFGPHFVDGYGSISLSDNRTKLTGWGTKFFLSQCLTGDIVDSIPGLPKCGPVKAFPLLTGTDTYAEGLEAVLGAYRAFYGEGAEERLLEQGRLLWMTRKLNDDGSPILWSLDAQ